MSTELLNKPNDFYSNSSRISNQSLNSFDNNKTIETKKCILYSDCVKLFNN